MRTCPTCKQLKSDQSFRDPGSRLIRPLGEPCSKCCADADLAALKRIERTYDEARERDLQILIDITNERRPVFAEQKEE